MAYKYAVLHGVADWMSHIGRTVEIARNEPDWWTEEWFTQTITDVHILPAHPTGPYRDMYYVLDSDRSGWGFDMNDYVTIRWETE